MSDLKPQPRQLPSIVWIVVIVLGSIALIGALFGSFYAFSNVEGFGSVLSLLVAWVVLRAGSSEEPRPRTQGDSFFTAVGIVSFAVMGLTIDQPGNYLYNRPLQWLFCPAETQLVREIEVFRPRPGTTQISQDFTCVNAAGRGVRDIGMLELIGVRFVEYVLIGYALIGANWLYMRVQRSR